MKEMPETWQPWMCKNPDHSHYPDTRAVLDQLARTRDADEAERFRRAIRGQS